MKKLLIPIALLMMVALGCNRTPKDPNEVDAEPFTISDSIFQENEYAEGYSYFTMNLDLPITKNQTLRQNILHWMLSTETEDPENYILSMKEDFFADDGSEPLSFYEENYSLSEQTDRYVTYINEGFIYTGGAHGMPWYNGTTFSKIDGNIVGYDMFEDPEQLAEIITINIRKQHFENYDLIEEMFDTGEEGSFVLPVNEPWIETDSIVFCYQSYEIAPYSAGMPLCKISKEDLWPYMNEKGKSLFTNTNK